MKESTRAGIMRFVEHGNKPGDFLTAVLSNNLRDAIGHGDEENRRDIVEICQFIHNEIPARCHGSWESMKFWIEMKQEEKGNDHS